MKITLMFLGGFIAIFCLIGYLLTKDQAWTVGTWIGIGIEWIGFLFCKD